ncbi:MAG: hypothetical protein IPM29_21320 [Planctomycetes bacterium]|nr:hypothetical protein [Planctomycetota bacterium]
MARRLAALLLLACALPAPRPAAQLPPEFADALAEALGSAPRDRADAALRARLQAAASSAHVRARALLEVARAFPDSPEADAAIRAGAAALLVSLGRSDALPELAALLGGEVGFAGLEEPTASEPALLVDGLGAALHARAARDDADRAVLAEAAELLALARVTRLLPAPARFASDAHLAVPVARAEDLLLHAIAAPPGELSWRDVGRLPRPLRTVWLPADRAEPELPALPPGRYVLALESPRTGWRSMRPVEVSDLDVVALCSGEQVAVLALRGRRPVEVSAVLRAGRDEVRFGQIDGVGVLSGRPDRALELDLADAAGHPATLDLPVPYTPSLPRDAVRVHWMVDRPLHRPGEDIVGRIAMKQLAWQGRGLDAQVASVPAADCALTLRAFVGGEHERVIELHTDALGIACFTLPVPPELPDGPVTLRLSRARAAGEERLAEVTPTRIERFVRPLVTLRCEGPATVDAGRAEPVAIALVAEWASGGPAAGLAVRAGVKRGWRDEPESALRTDGAGRAELTIAPPADTSERLAVTFTVQTPDGRTEVVTHAVRAEATGDDRVATASRSLGISGPRSLVVGMPAGFVVSGRPRTPVLLVRGRGDATAAQALHLDDDGRASIELTPTAAEWPFLDLTVATLTEIDRLRIPLHGAPARPPELTLPARCAPGATVPIRVDAGEPGVAVTVAVVDERIFALADDRTPAPRIALVPWLPTPRWELVRSLAAADPRRALAELLSEGRVPPPEPDRRMHGSPGAAGAAAGPGASAPPPLRADFRATAAFVTLVSDADGIAATSVAMPDDLTTWRVTVVSVAADGDGFLLRRTLAARLPLAAEPRLPRVLRAGDALAIPVLLDRAADAAASTDTPELTASALGDGTLAVDVAGTPPVPAGRTATASLALRAVAPGDAALRLDLRLGEHADSSSRALPVAPDAVDVPVVASGAGTRRVTVATPGDSTPDAGLEVVVLGTDAALRDLCRERLEDYPHGCIEQTLSGLLPFFAEARGARAHGRPAPTMDDAFRDRLRRGLAHVRELQDGPGGAFAWWPGDGVDPAMTAVVLHGLCVLRDAGLDPDAAGLRCDPSREPFVTALTRTVADAGDPNAEELAVAVLRRCPDCAAARNAVGALTDSDRALPRGLAVRAGLAWLAAGDHARAARCLERATSGDAPTARDHPIDAPVAVAAWQLELAFGLAPDADHAGAASALAQHVLAGRTSTLATGTALTALWLVADLRPAALGEVPVAVVAGRSVRELTLTEADGFRARLSLPFATQVDVTAEAETMLRLVVRGARRERASTHPASAEPLTIERALVDGDGRDVAALHCGEVIAVRIRVASSERVDYAVVECPLPAGFELPVPPRWVERFDDRIAFTLRRIDPGDVVERTIAVVPTLAGHALWPPVTVAAMYLDGVGGSSSGGFVEVAAARDEATASAAEESASPDDDAASGTTPARTRSRRHPDPAERAWQLADRLANAWHDGLDDETVFDESPTATRAAARAAQRLTELADLAARDPVAALSALSELRHRLPYRDPSGALWASQWWPQRCTGGALAPWRLALLTRLTQLERTTAADAVPELERRALAGVDVDDEVVSLLDVLDAERHGSERQLAQARLLQAALPALPSLVDELLETIEPSPATAALNAALREVLATGDADTRAAAFARLPLADRAAMPPASVAALAGPWQCGSIVETLAATDAGRTELLRLLADPEFLDHADYELADLLPRDLWRDAPLCAFEAIARYEPPREVADRLTGARVPTAALQCALAAADDADWTAALAGALRARRADGLGVALDAGTPRLAAWHTALAAAARDDAGALQELFARLRSDEASWAIDDSALDAFLLDRLAELAPSSWLAQHAEELDAERWELAFARLSAADRAGILRGTTVPLPTWSTPAGDDEVDALLACISRLSTADDEFDIDEPLRALCRCEAAAMRLRGQLTELPAPVWSAALDVLADALWLDSDTREPVDAPPIERALHLVRQFGPHATLDDAERRALRRALALRGLW